MFKIFTIYETLSHDDTFKIENKKYIFILERVIFLSGTLAKAYLYKILIPYFGGFLITIWIIFLVKIACYWDKPIFDFDMFKNQQNNTINNMKEGQEEELPPV